MKNTVLAVFCTIMAAMPVLTGCSVRNGIPAFTEDELAIIAGHGVMRVLTVSDSEDSLVLRTVCEDISDADLRSEAFSNLAERMIETVTDSMQDGVGIAAPQIGLSRRLVAVMRYDKEGMPFEIYPNIRIECFSSGKQSGLEGCLSIPEKSGNVERSEWVVISYTDPSSLEIVRDTVEGYTSVIFQHEADHLDGVLFTDRMNGNCPN